MMPHDIFTIEKKLYLRFLLGKITCFNRKVYVEMSSYIIHIQILGLWSVYVLGKIGNLGLLLL